MRVEAIVKLGGSVITFKEKPMTVNPEALNRLSKELYESGLRRLIVVHGGGSFGHPVALKYGLTEGFKRRIQLQGLVQTHGAMLKLNARVLKALENAGFAPVPIPPIASALASSGRLTTLFYEPFVRALKLSLTPVTFGDVVFDLERGFTIVSGDTLMAELSLRFNPSKVVFTVDVNGLYADNPRLNPNAELLSEIKASGLPKLISRLSSKFPDATGGIRLKLMEAYRIAQTGVDIYVINGLKPGRLTGVLRGAKVKCTVIRGVRGG